MFNYFFFFAHVGTFSGFVSYIFVICAYSSCVWYMTEMRNAFLICQNTFLDSEKFKNEIYIDPNPHSFTDNFIF